jgi:hypothetical protein
MTGTADGGGRSGQRERERQGGTVGERERERATETERGLRAAVSTEEENSGEAAPARRRPTTDLAARNFRERGGGPALEGK